MRDSLLLCLDLMIVVLLTNLLFHKKLVQETKFYLKKIFKKKSIMILAYALLALYLIFFTMFFYFSLGYQNENFSTLTKSFSQVFLGFLSKVFFNREFTLDTYSLVFFLFAFTFFSYLIRHLILAFYLEMIRNQDITYDYLSENKKQKNYRKISSNN